MVIRVASRTLAVPFADISRPKVYLDKNAFSLLWKCKRIPDRDLLRLRRRLCSRQYASRPNLVLSQWLLREMAPRLEHHQVERQISLELDFLASVPSFLLLKAPLDVITSEVHGALTGGSADVFFDEGWEFPLDVVDTWTSELQGLRADGSVFESHARQAVERIHGIFPDRGALAKRFTKELNDDPDLAVTNTALRTMRESWQRLGLPKDEALWPAPKALPSVWARAAFSTVFAQLSTRDQRKPKANDFLDWCHFIAAAHADDFVTNDSWTRRVAASCPPPKPGVVSFEEWAERVLR
jgi:hypothetical protein